MKKPSLILTKFFSSPMVITFLVIAVGLLTSYIAWVTSNQSVASLENERLTNQAKILQGALQERLATYEEILRGGAALFKVKGSNSENVTRNDWNNYVASLDINERYDGLVAIGYAAYVRSEDTDTFVQSVRDQGFADFSIAPEGQRDVYVPIVYIEPFDQVNQRAFGYDMFSETTRKTAMIQARDTGYPVLSKGVRLRQTSPTVDNYSGFLFYLPLYSGSPKTVAERREQLQGYVYAPIRGEDLFRGIVGDEMPTSSRFEAYDDLPYGKQNLIFSTKQPINSHLLTTTVNLGSSVWQLKLSPDDTLLTTSEQNRARVSLVGGIVVTLMVAAIVRYIFYSRARQFEFERKTEIQAAKDELLSLASHQLRTPATGVKQYLGMVLQGYAGEVSQTQRAMLEKANTSNERQLEIVSQILHVTRLEKGKLSLNMQSIDLTTMVKDVIDEQHDSSQLKHQTLQFRPPKKHIRITADGQYLRMAIENLLGNAIKYTHDGGSIVVSLKRMKSQTHITVVDNGVGIDSDNFHKLFQKFSRIDNELSVKEGGSGIGLYLIKQIIELHHGYIEVESRLGQGSTFRIVLPSDR